MFYAQNTEHCILRFYVKYTKYKILCRETKFKLDQYCLKYPLITNLYGWFWKK